MIVPTSGIVDEVQINISTYWGQEILCCPTVCSENEIQCKIMKCLLMTVLWEVTHLFLGIQYCSRQELYKAKKTILLSGSEKCILYILLHWLLFCSSHGNFHDRKFHISGFLKWLTWSSRVSLSCLCTSFQIVWSEVNISSVMAKVLDSTRVEVTVALWLKCVCCSSIKYFLECAKSFAMHVINLVVYCAGSDCGTPEMVSCHLNVFCRVSESICRTKFVERGDSIKEGGSASHSHPYFWTEASGQPYHGEAAVIEIASRLGSQQQSKLWRQQLFCSVEGNHNWLSSPCTHLSVY